MRSNDPGELIRPHLDKLYRLAYRLTGTRTDAEDLVQDVLVKVFARDELSSVRDLGAWLGRVLYNQFIDDRRRYGRMPIKLVDDEQTVEFAASDADAPEQQAAAAQQRNRLSRALAKLSEEQRVAVLLHDAEGYTLSEIEALTAAPIGTLKSRLHRARARLADLLKKDGTFSTPTACKSVDGVKTDAL